MGTGRRIIVTLLMAICFMSLLIAMASWHYRGERAHCFEELNEYAEGLAQEIRGTVEQDQKWLLRLAQAASQHGPDLAGYAPELFQLTDGIGPFTRMELIFPDGTALLSTGEQIETDLPVSQLAAAGPSISRRMADPLDPDRQILQAYVPIMRDGEAEALLCGVVDLAALPSLFTVDRFGGQAELYLVEGSSGNFLLDTLHTVPGSREDVNGRKAKGDYNAADIRADFQNQQAGTAIYYSNSVGEYLYTCYVPVGVADWIVMITVPESAAFQRAQSLLAAFYGMVALLLILFSGYFIWMLSDVRRERRVIDRQLRNIQYLLDVEEALFSAHIYPAHFSIALQKIADFVGAQTAFFWVVNQHSPVRQRLWISHERERLERSADIVEHFPGIFHTLQEQGSFLSYDLEQAAAGYPIDLKTSRQMNLRSAMIIPIKNLEGELVGVLGATDLQDHSWKDARPLHQASLAFSMTVNHYEIHQALIKMGQVDGLTGLKNRNAYHQALEQLSRAELKSFACIYMDANGLHEINNHLGHDAGDAMLRAVADALLCTFGAEFSYRLGGDEFVAFCKDQTEADVRKWAAQVKQAVERAGYHISAGTEWQESPVDLKQTVSAAEAAMQEDKKQYYAQNGGERQMRMLDDRLTRLRTEKQDADAFLSVLAKEFPGVYFVDLDTDQARHVFIPPYFAQMLEETGGRFSAALRLYAQRIVPPAWRDAFEQFCDYSWLSEQLKQAGPKLVYQRTDGCWLQLQVINFQKDEGRAAEALWIFSSCQR